MSKVAPQGSQDKYQLADWLRGRFYFIKQQGGQTIYYDALTGVRTLTKMHLASQIVGKLIEQNITVDDPHAFSWDIVKNTHFTPIVLQEVYLPHRPKVVNIQGNHHLNVWSEPSVKPDNAAELFSQPDIDGGLIGGASLKARDFFEIIKAAG